GNGNYSLDHTAATYLVNAGSPSEPETNVQTTHVSTGGATMVEFTAKVPGTYSIVDHSLGRLEKGAAAQIVVDGPANPEIFQPLSPGAARGESITVYLSPRLARIVSSAARQARR